MTKSRSRIDPLSFREELRLIKFIVDPLPDASDIAYFQETPSDDPNFHAFSWAFNIHRTLHIRPSWRAPSKLLMQQRLTVGEKTGPLSFPIKWGGTTISFNDAGEAILHGDVAHSFWTALIEHDGKGIPKPENT
jgi:hypothetical protein